MCNLVHVGGPILRELIMADRADPKIGHARRLQGAETVLIVALAALVVIKGGGALMGVLSGMGQMMIAVFRALAG